MSSTEAFFDVAWNGTTGADGDSEATFEDFLGYKISEWIFVLHLLTEPDQELAATTYNGKMVLCIRPNNRSNRIGDSVNQDKSYAGQI